MKNKLLKITALAASLAIGLSVLGCMLATAQPAAELTDTYADLSVPSSVTPNFEVFASHADTGLSVAGRKSASGESSLVYSAPSDKAFDELTLDIQLVEGFYSVANDLKLEYKLKGEDEYKAIAVTEGEKIDIDEISSTGYDFKTLSVSAALPENAVELKVSLLNDVAWTFMLNTLKVTLKDLSQGGEEGVEPAAELTDTYADLSVPSSVTPNFEAFASHADTGLSVAGRKSASGESSLIYSAPADKAFGKFTIDLQIADGFELITRDLKVEYRLKDSEEYTQIAVTEGEKVDVDEISTTGYDFKTQSVSAELPEKAVELKISLLNDVPWAFMLNELKLELRYIDIEEGPQNPEELPEPKPEPEPEPEKKPEPTGVIDEMVDFSKMSAHTDNFTVYNPHGESGLSVIGRTDEKSESSVVYSASGDKFINAFKLNVQFFEGFFNIAKDIKLEANTDKSSEYKAVSLISEAAKAIPGSANASFKTMLLTADLPAGVKNVKITLLNDVAWTLFLERAELSLGSDAYEGIIYGAFTDELADLSMLSDKSDNIEAFATHPEFGLSVVGKTNGEPGYIQYKVNDKRITSAEIKLVVADGYFDAAKHFSVQSRSTGAAAWRDCKLNITSTVKHPANAKFQIVTVKVDTSASLTGDLRLNFTNDVNWVLFADKVTINTDKLDGSPKTSDESNLPLLFSALVLAALGAIWVIRKEAEKLF